MILRPFELLYQAVTDVKNYFYDQNWFTATKLPIPVVSVGNLSFGGTGKTPFIQMLAQSFPDKKVAIICRSYKASLTEPQKVDVNVPGAAKIFGDEAVLLQKGLPNCSVWSGPVKAEAAKACLIESPELILIDDGFSHRQLIRNYDIVLFDATKLQAGYSRESFSSLERANAVVLTKIQSQNISAVKKFTEKVVRLFPQLKSAIYETQSQIRLKVDKKTPLFVFCGIANPESLRQNLLDEKFQVVHFEKFEDHQRYDDKLQGQLVEKYLVFMKSNPGLQIVTTEKDMMKINNPWLREKIIVIDYQMTMGAQQKQDLLEKISTSFKS